MDQHERAAILAEAHRNLERLADLRVEHRDHDDDAVTQWARGMPKPQPAQRSRQPTAEQINSLRSRNWTAFVDDRIARAFQAHDRVRLEAMGQLIGAERAKHRDELAQVKAALELRINALSAELNKLRGFTDGEVIDLPAWPRRRSDAA